MKVCYGQVYFPHINYTVDIRPFKPPPNEIGKALAWIQRKDKYGCTVYLPGHQSPGEVAHEFVHVLQYICSDRHITFEDEFEHMAYMMQHLMGRVFGYRWKPKKQRRRRRRKK
jgi:hypothetical protein